MSKMTMDAFVERAKTRALKPTVFTIGYQTYGSNPEDFFRKLREIYNGTDKNIVLLDVRKHAWCGWSMIFRKEYLSHMVPEKTHGRVVYMHNYKLGNPEHDDRSNSRRINNDLIFRNCKQFGNFDELTKQYQIIILLCAERFYTQCHRAVVANYLNLFYNYEVKHL